ncbi:hypothetical protein HMPREF9103_01670 [Lentilactobacillus parafarraginis F0439]|uniref:Uncharacterized protein n=1 Tax=Lentilactobacillus parafarraginis F0439 TaxID=797515 RepID=G9ZPL6_9LACO|nr:hypothetical protein HMPREF9103_01670 [Lentilactobacillus parafarraginis F0439]
MQVLSFEYKKKKWKLIAYHYGRHHSANRLANRRAYWSIARKQL